MAHLLTHWWQQQSNSHSDRLHHQLRETRLEYTPSQYENSTTGVQRSKESSNILYKHVLLQCGLVSDSKSVH